MWLAWYRTVAAKCVTRNYNAFLSSFRKSLYSTAAKEEEKEEEKKKETSKLCERF